MLKGKKIEAFELCSTRKKCFACSYWLVKMNSERSGKYCIVLAGKAGRKEGREILCGKKINPFLHFDFSLP